jgi:tRNA 5-methylaminomethyl-2-thiouridine biosynthesis bifunctional protein
VSKSQGNNTIEWRGGVPVAARFGDVYYSLENGLAEAEFTFLGGIDAPKIWQGRSHFTICETGFGTGLNFLASYKKWLESGASGRLTFISTEAFPLSDTDLSRAHAAFSTLEPFAKKLREAWPPNTKGYHLRHFEGGKIQLLLLFGDAAETLTQLSAKVDAWFLDGFAPAKNPEMWSEALFDQMVRLSNPGAPFATFTAAAMVKSRLSARGFDVRKAPGYGKKRHRLLGKLRAHAQKTCDTVCHEWAQLNTAKPGRTTVIGAGVAGRALTAELTHRGHPVTLFGGSRPAASDVPAAVLAPGFQAGPQPTTAFVTSAFAHACWLPAYEGAWAAKRGVELCAGDEAEQRRFRRIQDLLGWDESWVTATSKGLTYPRSGSLDTKKALSNLYSGPVNTSVVERLEKTSAGWLLICDDHRFETANLVLAAGAGTQHLLPGAHHIGLTARAGQVEMVASDLSGIPQRSVAASGYITAPSGGYQSLGSTFTEYHGDAQQNPATTKAATAEILDKINAEFGATVAAQQGLTSWAGIRAATIDYMPVIGPVPNWQQAADRFAPLSKDRKITGLGPMPYQDGLYIMAGFGSKGFQQAPYAAQYMAAHLCGDALPMAADVAAYLHPARTFIRRLIRGGRY